MAWFQKSFVSFFKSLAKNNDVAWFNEHRDAYVAAVKTPFAAFAREMLDRIGAVDTDVRIAPKEAISRITRDTRFVADKSPYNTHLTCTVSRYGRASREHPATNFRLSAKGAVVFGGVTMPSAATVARLRELITTDGKVLAKAIAKRAFVDHFGELQGEPLKRVPEALRDAIAREPLVGRRRWFFRAELPVALVTSDELCDVLMAHWRASRDVNTFLQRAFP